MIENPSTMCEYHAPLIAFKNASGWSLVQGNCNHWDCVRCGISRAKTEYWRIVNGSEIHSEQNRKLYFMTITCRGASLTKKKSEEKYLEWTDKLGTSIRNRAAKHGQLWSYAAVTERQKRGMPHSHFVTTYCPDDATLTWNVYKQREEIRSEWLGGAIVRAGLGKIYNLTEIREPSAVSRYVAKYLFKQTALIIWPKGWKRVRYSQNWPKRDFESDCGEAFAILTTIDWQRLYKINQVIRSSEQEIVGMCLARGIMVKLIETDKNDPTQSLR